MKKNSFIALILVCAFFLGAFTSCNTPSEDTQIESESKTTENNTATEEVSESSEAVESDSAAEDGAESSETSENDTVSENIELFGEHADIIELADSLKNNVTAYFPDGSRDSMVYENMNMSLEYALDASLPQQVTALKNKSGSNYLENTMDVFIKMTNGARYFAKNSYTDGVPNIYRLGYYYYEMRSEGQTFGAEIGNVDTFKVDVNNITGKNQVKTLEKREGSVYVVNDDNVTDPYVSITRKLKVDTSIYTVLEITMRADANTDTKADVYFIAGGQNAFNGGQRVSFSVNTDGEYHTYLVPLYMGADYSGDLTALRFDINGNGACYEISGIRFLSVDTDGAPKGLSLCRSWGVYSDKMYQVVQVAATNETSGIEEIGIQTVINADTVAKLVIKDKCEELHTSIAGVDWATVEYVGFDIKDTGIFGYILPFDGKGGSIRIELVEGKYIIEQTMTPGEGTIIPSRTDYNVEKQYYNWVDGGNVNDFYMGSRIYTDDRHDFEEFLNEAYCERNPLDEIKFKIYNGYSTGAKYVGYDSLRGCYRFELSGSDFSTAYYKEPGKHLRVNFALRGDDRDRDIYVMTYTKSGQLECAALLDGNDVMIPVPLEVGKNFSEQHGERGLFNLDDATYGEVIFPVAVKANEKYEYTVLNLYQNWGNYPLKQVSWIQFHSPYYHFSTGVTETNCLLPWMFTDRTWYNTLPDHRGMSAPLWKDQPQHTYAGEHDWLMYLDEEGNEIRWENRQNVIDSYGPTYASVTFEAISYDGKIKISYTHTEMPQTDENRTYYEMTYEVLEDITVNNFVTDFHFYKVDPNDSTGLYQKVGYLNEQNESVVVDANLTSSPVKYVLGDECPYFSFFDMDNHSYSNGYANLSFLVYNSEFTIGGEKANPSFAIVNYSDTVYITLNIEEKTTLKAGDKFTINAILLPWGSQQLEDGIIDEATNNFEYTMTLPDGSLYMDKNVRDVRENTLLDPLKTIAGENCEKVESVFIPKVKTTNGESAEFTLTGGYNNVAVRIYGFEKMTVPVIYEKVNGEWQIYDVSSKAAGTDPHAYDGYCVYYDGDGTYSYSFVTEMDGKTDRTFKIVVDGNYEEWRKETVPEKNPDYLKVYIDPKEMAQALSDATDFFESATVSEDGSYVTAKPLIGGPYGESYAVIYKDTTGEVESGQYLVFKYRVPADNAEKLNDFDIYISTVNNNTNKNDSLTFSPIQDGEWHVAILDISRFTHPSFNEEDGKYFCKYIRFDFFNKRHTEGVALDIAYIGMDSSLEEICKLNQEEFNELPIHAGSIVGSVDTFTYETYFDIIIDPEADVKISSLPFGSALDGANGFKQALNVGSKEGGPKNTLPITVGNDMKITLKGWCIVGGGVSKYVWSADGGLTWNDFGNQDSLARVPENYLGVAKALSSSKGYENAEASLQNSSFQGTNGITIDLSAYAGKTVDIVVAAIPVEETDSLCLLYRFTDLEIPAAE